MCFKWCNPVLLRYWHVTNQTTNSTPRITTVSHKLQIAYCISIVTASFGNRRFIILFTKAHHYLISWASRIQWHFHTPVIMYSVFQFFLLPEDVLFVFAMWCLALAKSHAARPRSFLAFSYYVLWRKTTFTADSYLYQHSLVIATDLLRIHKI